MRWIGMGTGAAEDVPAEGPRHLRVDVRIEARKMRASMEALVRFSRAVSEADDPGAILRMLPKEVVGPAGGDAALVVQIGASGALEIVSSVDLPEALASRALEADLIGPEISAELVAASNGRFARAEVLPLVSSGDLFGALVLLFAPGELPDGEARTLAVGLADLAAIALGKAHQLAALARSNAELRASREALARAHKMQALGTMAAGVAHDLKNILNPLSLYLQLLKRKLKDPAPDVADSLTEMSEVIRRGVMTIDRLRDFARQKPESAVAAVSLDELTRDAVRLGAARAAARKAPIRFREELGAPPPVRVSSHEYVNAVVNLVNNAIDALGDHGTVTVSTGTEGDMAVVSVADDGPGMPPEVEKRVFEPFFSTKGADGTGLGLAMVYAFVQRHRGRVSLETAPGKGTRFTLCFPVP
jgi:signal transduction histidine kinase